MLTPRLVPFTPTRSLVMPATGASAALVGWLLGLLWVGWLRGGPGPLTVDPRGEAVRLLASVAAVVAAGSVWAEGRLVRSPTRRRVAATGLAGVVAGLVAWGVGALASLLLAAGEVAPHTATLRATLPLWLSIGAGLATAGLVVRRGRFVIDRAQRRWDLPLLVPPPVADEPARDTWITHLIGAPAAAVAGALVSYVAGLVGPGRFEAVGLGAAAVGALWGVFASGWPLRTVQGWLRVLRGARPGWRVPLDADDPALAERFVGAFPHGVDLHLPASDAVAELHMSVVARPDGWAARGLTVQPISVIRLAERVDLSYDPGLPAPWETRLRSEDRVRLGERAEVELIVLSREGAP